MGISSVASETTYLIRSAVPYVGGWLFAAAAGVGPFGEACRISNELDGRNSDLIDLKTYRYRSQAGAVPSRSDGQPALSEQTV